MEKQVVERYLSKEVGIQTNTTTYLKGIILEVLVDSVIIQQANNLEVVVPFSNIAYIKEVLRREPRY